MITRSWQICSGDEELTGTMLYMSKWLSRDTDGAAKSVPGPSTGTAGSKSIEHVKSGRRSAAAVCVFGAEGCTMP